MHPASASNPHHRELSAWFARHRAVIEQAMAATDDAAAPGVVASLNQPAPAWRAATLQLMILIADGDLSAFFNLQDWQHRQFALLLADIFAKPDAPGIHELAERVHRAGHADTAGLRHAQPYQFLVQAIDAELLDAEQ